LFTRIASVSKQYSLVPAKRRWRFAAREVFNRNLRRRALDCQPIYLYSRRCPKCLRKRRRSCVTAFLVYAPV